MTKPSKGIGIDEHMTALQEKCCEFHEQICDASPKHSKKVSTPVNMNDFVVNVCGIDERSVNTQSSPNKKKQKTLLRRKKK